MSVLPELNLLSFYARRISSRVRLLFVRETKVYLGLKITGAAAWRKIPARELVVESKSVTGLKPRLE